MSMPILDPGAAPARFRLDRGVGLAPWYLPLRGRLTMVASLCLRAHACLGVSHA